MKIVLLFLSLALLKTASAQDVYPLHPSVGDTISLQEKLDYSLFSKVENTGFKEATIQFLNEGFVLVIKTTDHTDLDTETELHLISTKKDTIALSQEEIIEEQKKIQKVNEYFNYLVEEAKKPKSSPSEPQLKQVPPLRLEGPMAEQMKKEARMKVRVETDRRMEEEFQMGLRPRQLFIQFD